ncbi:MAG: hypothetical protein HYV16_03220 [Gammaproteobacteria bacterium]|nr:hypothetical protein [Gammaproteobacteria bacterium]
MEQQRLRRRLALHGGVGMLCGLGLAISLLAELTEPAARPALLHFLGGLIAAVLGGLHDVRHVGAGRRAASDALSGAD